MSLESLPQLRAELLKAEISVLATKISSVVDTLWKVRTASITLWSAVLGVGLGSFSDPKVPVIPLLVLSCLLPILFINIDARNNRWYRRLSNRESAIQQYLNDPDSQFPDPFPIYDIAGENTFRGDTRRTWEFSLLRSLVDPIPMSFYGGQLVFSAAACAIYGPGSYRFLFLPAAILSILGLYCTALLLRRKVLRKK